MGSYWYWSSSQYGDTCWYLSDPSPIRGKRIQKYKYSAKEYRNINTRQNTEMQILGKKNTEIQKQQESVENIFELLFIQEVVFWLIMELLQWSFSYYLHVLSMLIIITFYEIFGTGTGGASASLSAILGTLLVWCWSRIIWYLCDICDIKQFTILKFIWILWYFVIF